MFIWPQNCGKMHFLHPSGIGFDSFCSSFPSAFVERCQDSFVVQCCDSLSWAPLSSSEAAAL